jgi:hypothetical protein
MRRFALRKLALLTAALGATALSAGEARDATRRAPLLPAESCAFPVADEAKRTPGGEGPRLMAGLGYAGIAADSENGEARAWFAQGVRLIWAFDEAEAIRAFRRAQAIDPNCALCFFGEAWARGPTINLQPRTEELAAARTAAERALALSDGLSRRDRLLVRGMALRTRAGPAFSNAAYADFMERAARRMPDDDTLAVMAADARMVTSHGMRPGSPTQRLLERVLARNPDHSGAIHFYIHLTDWTDEQRLAEPYADRLGRLAPAASHLVHMPSHTYYGVGRYRDAAAVNVAAIAADTRFVDKMRPAPSFYRTGLLRHNMQFAINSALAQGDGATALSVSDQYRVQYLTGDVNPGSRLLGSATYYSLGLYAPVDAVLAAPEPAHALDKAMRHYARGEALARRGDAGAVRAEAAAIAAIRGGTQAPSLGQGGSALAEIFQHVLEGRAAMLARDPAAAATAYRAAMDRQLAAGFGFDPPLFWYSVRRSLAAAQIASGDMAGAREQLLASLRRWPNDPLSLYALSLAERGLGAGAAADAALAQARAGWSGDITSVPLARI